MVRVLPLGSLHEGARIVAAQRAWVLCSQRGVVVLGSQGVDDNQHACTAEASVCGLGQRGEADAVLCYTFVGFCGGGVRVRALAAKEQSPRVSRTAPVRLVRVTPHPAIGFPSWSATGSESRNDCEGARQGRRGAAGSSDRTIASRVSSVAVKAAYTESSCSAPLGVWSLIVSTESALAPCAAMQASGAARRSRRTRDI